MVLLAAGIIATAIGIPFGAPWLGLVIIAGAALPVLLLGGLVTIIGWVDTGRWGWWL